MQKRSTEDAVNASSRAHNSYTTGFRTTPYSRPQRAASTAKMPPPPPRASAGAAHLTRSTQDLPVQRSEPLAIWAAVTSRRPLQTAHTTMDDSFLDVRVSSLMHHNWDFPTAPRGAIFVLATTTYKALEDVGRLKASLRFALDLALKTSSPLSADIVHVTVELCDLVRNMYSARYSPKCFSEDIKKTRGSRPRNRQVELDSSASDRSVEARQRCHHDEPTSGREKSKRVMPALTTYSDTGPDPPGVSDRGKRPPRQVTPRVFHAADPLGSAPPFPPWIARPRGTHRNDSPHSSPETRPTLGPLMPHGNHLPDGSSHPQLTPQSLEIITAATTAAQNQHLASIGFLPRGAATPSDESISNSASLPLAARDASPIPPRILSPPPHVNAPTSGPVVPSSFSMDNAIHHLQVDRSPDSPSSHAQNRFSHYFVSKMQAEYRTLDTHRVPRVQPLQFSPEMDGTAATQLLVQSMRDALSGIFAVAGPWGSVTMRSPSWVSSWHAPLLKLTKVLIVPNRNDTHSLHRLVDDLFAQLQERLASGVDGPGAFETLLTDVADHFDRAPRGAALASLQKFGVPSGTTF